MSKLKSILILIINLVLLSKTATTNNNNNNIFQPKQTVNEDYDTDEFYSSDYYEDEKIKTILFQLPSQQPILNPLLFKLKPAIPQTFENTCGLAKPKIGQYVANGKKTDHYLWPWNVQLIINPNFYSDYQNEHKIFCGGTIISQNYILTAAHCFDELLTQKNSKTFNNKLLHLTAKNTLIVFNSISSENPVSRKRSTIKLYADKIIIHSKYTKNNNDILDENFEERLNYIINNLGKKIETGPRNDIALIRFTLNQKLTPICLPPQVNLKQQTTYDDRFINCRILGQGFMNEYDEENFIISKNLQIANVYISPNDVCKSKFESNEIREKINENTLCIVGPIHPCLGDSGGPLVCMNKFTNLWHLVGVTSFAVSSNQNDRCGQFKSAVFAKVANYLDWIYTNINY
jgi:hypothetical protein